MKREKKRKLIFRTVGLFFGVLALVLFVGTVGMLLYAGIIQKDGENPIELVFSEDIFKSFQDILTGNSSEQKIPDDISEDERLIQEALAAGEKVIPVNSADAESIKLLFAGDILLDEPGVCNTY